jgi:hypothetical protein
MNPDTPTAPSRLRKTPSPSGGKVVVTVDYSLPAAIETTERSSDSCNWVTFAFVDGHMGAIPGESDEGRQIGREC